MAVSLGFLAIGRYCTLNRFISCCLDLDEQVDQLADDDDISALARLPLLAATGIHQLVHLYILASFLATVFKPCIRGDWSQRLSRPALGSLLGSSLAQDKGLLESENLLLSVPSRGRVAVPMLSACTSKCRRTFPRYPRQDLEFQVRFQGMTCTCDNPNPKTAYTHG